MFRTDAVKSCRGIITRVKYRRGRQLKVSAQYKSKSARGCKMHPPVPHTLPFIYRLAEQLCCAMVFVDKNRKQDFLFKFILYKEREKKKDRETAKRKNLLKALLETVVCKILPKIQSK